MRRVASLALATALGAGLFVWLRDPAPDPGAVAVGSDARDERPRDAPLARAEPLRTAIEAPVAPAPAASAPHAPAPTPPASDARALVHGRVTTTDGAPIEAALVSLTSASKTVVATDADGLYSLEPAFGWTACGAVVASHPEYVTSSAPIDAQSLEEAGARNVRVDLVLVRGRSVVVSVQDERGAPIDRAHVRLCEASEHDAGRIAALVEDLVAISSRQNASLLVAAGITSESGTARLQVTPGSFELQVRADGFVPELDRRVAVADDSEEPRIEVVLSRGNRLVGRVVDAADGSAVEGARVLVWDTRMLQRSESGPDGTFEQAGLGLDRTRVDLAVSHPSYAAAWLARWPVHDPPLVELRRDRLFHARLVDDATEDELVGSLVVTHVLPDVLRHTSVLSRFVAPAAAIELEGGVLSVHVPERVSELVLEHELYEREVVDVPAQGPLPSEVTLRMRPVRELVLEIVDGDTGEPLRAAVQLFAFVPGAEAHWVHSSRQLPLVPSEQPGVFRLRSDLIHRDEGARLYVRHGGYRDAQVEYHEPGGDPPPVLRIELIPLE